MYPNDRRIPQRLAQIRYEPPPGQPASGGFTNWLAVLRQGGLPRRRELPITAEVSPLFVTNALLRVKPEVAFRGDANFDHELDITDAIAIAILETLLFGKELRCREAADFNDDGLLDISDPVAILNHLFLGGGGMSPREAFCGG